MTEATEFDEVLKNVLETELDEEAELADWVTKAKLSDKGVNAVKAALRILSAFKDELPKDALDKLASLAGYPKPDMGGYPSPQSKDGEPVKKEEETVENVPEVVQKKLDSIEAENAALKESNEKITKALEAQKDAADLAAWTAKAKEELSHYPGESIDDIAKSLHALAKVDEKMAEAQFATMKKASDALKESEILKSAGDVGRIAAGSAMETIEKAADEMLEKSTDVEMTKEKAIQKVLEKRPDLYTKYLEESAN